MKSENNIRQSNIELLRIIAIIGVVILHYNNPGIGKGFVFVEENSPNFWFLYYIESMFACSVDLFVLISGFFLCRSAKRNVGKIAEMIIEVIVVAAAVYLLRCAIKNDLFSYRGLFRCLIPSNYFVVLYSVLYLISPYINLILNVLSEKGIKKLVILLMIVFSFYPTFIDVFYELTGFQYMGLSSIGAYGSQYGYQIINFMLMYVIGAYINRKQDRAKQINKGELVITLLIVPLFLALWSRLNDMTGFFNEKSAWEYCNPLVILEAVIFFIIFLKVNIPYNKTINSFGKSTLMVFLFHTFFLEFACIERFVSGSLPVLVIHVIVSSVLIVLLCYPVHLLYEVFRKMMVVPFIKRLHLPVLNISDLEH